VKNLKVILAVMVIFGAGVVTGVVVTRARIRSVAAHPPTAFPGGPPGSGMWGPSRTQFVQKMHRQLDLSKDQCGQVEKIMKESHERMAKLWEPIAPQAREETRKVREQIFTVLSPEQRPKFDEVFKAKNRKDKERSNTNAIELRKDSGSLKECWTLQTGI
jgi:Spy/CpxP family protein refolding chaperone